MHCAWQPGATYPSRQGIEIKRWAKHHNLTCLIVDEPTHYAGNTLDIAWTNINRAQAWVDCNKYATSNHLPIRGRVLTGSRKRDQESSQIRVTLGNLPKFALAVTQWTHLPLVLDTVHKADKYANNLCSALTDAVKAAGTQRDTRHGKYAPWWTPEFKLARTEYRAAVTLEQQWVHTKKLRSTLRAAKKEHQMRQVEAITTPTAEFKLMCSAESRQASVPPLLNHQGRMYTNPAEQAVIFRDAILVRHQAKDDLPPLNAPSTNQIPWNDHVSDEEIRTCTIGCANTAPGADGISVEFLQTCEKTIGLFVSTLFSACIRLGIHPSCSKLAEVVLICNVTGLIPCVCTVYASTVGMEYRA